MKGKEMKETFKGKNEPVGTRAGGLNGMRSGV